MPLKILNTDCRFKKFYRAYCNIKDSNKICKCGKKFKRTFNSQKYCSKKCFKDSRKKYYEANKERIIKKNIEYYQSNKKNGK